MCVCTRARLCVCVCVCVHMQLSRHAKGMRGGGRQSNGGARGALTAIVNVAYPMRVLSHTDVD
jgi:hypothetical protein